MTRDEFNKYVKLTSRKLFMIAFRMLENQAEAEDAVQETYIKLWKMGSKLDEYESTEALATTMLRNHCIDMLRKKRIVSEYDSTLKEEHFPSVDELLERSESFLIIHKIIDSMDSTYADMIRMHDLEGLSYEEIVEKTGVNINTLRVYLSRARTIVRQEYLKHFNEKRRN